MVKFDVHTLAADANEPIIERHLPHIQDLVLL